MTAIRDTVQPSISQNPGTTFTATPGWRSRSTCSRPRPILQM